MRARKNKFLLQLPIFLIFLFACVSPNPAKQHHDHSELERWKNAVIQLEGVTDSVSSRERSQHLFELSDKLREGKISRDEFIRASQEIERGNRDKRYQGTAIFLEHEGRHYLLTSRHVLFDELSAKRMLKEELERLQGAPATFRDSVLKSAYERAQNTIFSVIFRVPSVNEILEEQVEKQRAFLMNLAAGPDWIHSYTFSNPTIDLAIISLNQRNTDFVKELKSLGYQPIHLNDISDQPSSEGADVFIVGYPSFSSIFRKELTSAWSSSFASVPNYAFGKVSMLHDKLYFFWCDMSVYPGFSGSPVIEDNKLVGIVSGQQRIPLDRVVKTDEEESIEPDPTLLVRIPFGNIIKAKFVKPLLEEQHKKDLNLKK